MDKAEVEERTLALLAEICDDEVVYEERDIDLFEAGLLDSMAAIEVLVGIEDEFGVEIAPTAVEREEMNSVNKIIHQIAIRVG
ncbi:D-alanine--poly(phosphoribitol) ligase subunit DltC [Arabiibacter massiliensis]|uniref:D-alanine--poly(phosphoribitol) ligase subunit DltC n=1 Tax=Arabiibacter massiliensis TaxID=1870985 RepID=UPI0009BC2627|nr:D-alanine--poly(phosphoribitol) ligase subunit DltC [Arabiibacter massiliensis]